MPNYEYFCTNCSRSVSIVRSVANRNNKIECPYCLHLGEGRRVFTACAIKAGDQIRFVPSNLSEKLAGPGVVGAKGNARTSVLTHQGCGCK